MFPHTITIYRHAEVDGKDIITKQVIPGFYWYGGTGITGGNKGATEEDSATIVSSPERAQDYGTAWDVKPRDRVVQGAGPDVTTLKEIKGITVLRVDENICGSGVDNITITGR